MIEKQTIPGPHVLHVEQRVHKTTKRPLAPHETLCARNPAKHLHERYRCPHGERTWCIGDIKPSRTEIEEVHHARLGCDCVIGSRYSGSAE